MRPLKTPESSDSEHDSYTQHSQKSCPLQDQTCLTLPIHLSTHPLISKQNRYTAKVSYDANRRLIFAIMCNATTLKMNPKLSTNTTTGSTLRPGDSSVYNFNMVLLLPPAPADLVLDGRALAAVAARSAAARRFRTVFGPPGGAGEAGRAVLEPVEIGACGSGLAEDIV